MPYIAASDFGENQIGPLMVTLRASNAHGVIPHQVKPA